MKIRLGKWLPTKTEWCWLLLLVWLAYSAVMLWKIQVRNGGAGMCITR